MPPSQEHPPGHRPWKSSEGTRSSPKGTNKLIRACSTKVRKVFVPTDTLDDDYPPVRVSYIESEPWGLSKQDSFLEDDAISLIDSRPMDQDLDATTKTSRIEQLLAAFPNPQTVGSGTKVLAKPISNLNHLRPRRSILSETTSEPETDYCSYDSAFTNRKPTRNMTTVSHSTNDLTSVSQAHQQLQQPSDVTTTPPRLRRNPMDLPDAKLLLEDKGHSSTDDSETSTLKDGLRRNSMLSYDSLAPPDIRRHPARPAAQTTRGIRRVEKDSPPRASQRQFFDARRVPHAPSPLQQPAYTTNAPVHDVIPTKKVPRKPVADPKKSRQYLKYQPRVETETTVHKNSAIPTLRNLLSPHPELHIEHAPFRSQKSGLKPDQKDDQPSTSVFASGTVDLPKEILASSPSPTPQRVRRPPRHYRCTGITRYRLRLVKEKKKNSGVAKGKARRVEKHDAIRYSDNRESQYWGGSFEDDSFLTALPPSPAFSSTARNSSNSRDVGDRLTSFRKKAKIVVIDLLKGPDPDYITRSKRMQKRSSKSRSDGPAAASRRH